MGDRSALGADVVFEHPHAPGRDALDILTTIGATRALTPSLWIGIEAVGSDLEGLWDAEEAEGGATVLVGPTIAVALSKRCRLVVGGGPVLRTTASREQVLVRDPQLSSRSMNGYVISSSLRFGW